MVRLPNGPTLQGPLSASYVALLLAVALVVIGLALMAEAVR